MVAGNPTYLTGDATRPVGPGLKFICHVCNDVGGWGAGFVLAVSRRWAEPERRYRTMAREGACRLGVTEFVQVEDDLVVCNMVAQRGFPTALFATALDIGALDRCLRSVALSAQLHKPASLHMPRIGCGIAGGRWADVEPLLAALPVPVFVYDLPGQPFRDRA